VESVEPSKLGCTSALDEARVSRIVREWYKKTAKREQKRLVRDSYHRIEFIVTNHFLEKYLPKRGLVLDAGGGTGTYAIQLAKKGYDLVLLDLTPELLAIARKQIQKANLLGRIKMITEGTISDLSQFPEATFDAVMCLGGALNHIVDVRQRNEAVAELARVAKKDSPIFISVISRLGLMASILVNTPNEIQDCRHHLENGDYIPRILPRSKVTGFTAAHWFLPEELTRLCERHRVQVLEVAALEGLSSLHNKEVNRIAKDKRKWNAWIDIMLRTCNHPSIVGSSEHFLVVGRRMK
jgi:ubiquinone/menaquinone biosynthesis C-methylase UbiE